MARTKGPEAIREWLSKQGKTQEWLAEQLGVSQGTVSAWIRGSEPKASLAVKIQRVTGVPVEAWE